MDRIDISLLNDNEKQGLVCMFYARMPKEDPRYKKRFNDWKVLAKKFGRKESTYKNDKDVFDTFFKSNNRIGWQSDNNLDKRKPGYQHVYDIYKDVDDTILEEAVRKIIEDYSEETRNYISMKCGHPETVHEIIYGEKNVSIGGIYTLKEELTKDKIIFLTLGGDIGKSTVDWKPGFSGICHITKEPYDLGYIKKGKNKYFKIDVEIDCFFEKPFKREDFIRYLDAFDAAYIGPELTRDPSQAISLLDTKKAIAILRAIIERYPDLETLLRNLFGDKLINRAKGSIEIMIPVSLKYGESKNEILASVEEKINKEVSQSSLNEATIDRVRGGKNILYYGVPGSGKSYKIDKEIKSEGAESRTERVVFHPDYAYADLVGQISPKLKENEKGEKKLTYEFIPGPFTKILKRAYFDYKNKYYFVIEELNRGNAPAIFGDIFQLLDRNSDGTGKYAITNFDLGREVYSDELHEVRLPSNLSIYATMNTSDQNVFTLDTAFQRRWSMKHVKNDIKSVSYADTQIGGSEITWGEFASAINDEILKYDEEMLSAEDKQLGAYFIRENELGSDEFPEKALKYLWNDVFKMDHDRIFNSKYRSISELIDSYLAEVEKGNDPLKRVMSEDIYEKMKTMSIENTEVINKEN